MTHRFHTIDNVLEWTGDFYRRLAARLNHAAKTADERTAMVLQFVEQHAWEAVRATERHRQLAPPATLATRLARAPEMSSAEDAEQLLTLLNTTSPEDLLDGMLKLHGRMEDLYDALVGVDGPESKHELFAALRDREHHELMRLARDIPID